MSSSSAMLHERARSLLTLIDGLEIENDLASARRTVDDWRTEMSTLINNIHLSTTNKLDSITDRLQQLKQRQSAILSQDIIPTLHKVVVERRKHLSEQELNEIKKKITKIDGDLQTFGRLLTKVTSDERKLVEQLEILKNMQRENAQLSIFDDISTPKRRFTLDSNHSPFIAVSDHPYMLIEDDNHLVLYDGERRINEMPWNGQREESFSGSIKDLVYSDYLEQFCILSSLNFFTLDPHMLTLEKSEQLRPSTGCHFQSVACLPNSSDVYFALATSGTRTNIERWSLVSGSQIRRWYHDIFESDDRHVSCIRANETCLAVCIKQQKIEKSHHNDSNYWRIDLFDFSLVRMYRGVNLKVGGLGTYISSFDSRLWLAVNGNDIWLLDEQGRCIEEKTINERDQLLNIIVRNEDTNGQRQFIIKLSKPAELRLT